jgi:hypothetical protein
MRHILSSHKTKKAEDVLTMKKLEKNELISSIMVYCKLLQIRLKGCNERVDLDEDKNCLKLFGSIFYTEHSWGCF